MTDLWVKYRIQPDRVNRGQTEALRPPSSSEILSAALNLDGVEIVESVGVTFEDMPEGYDGLILAVPSRGWNGPGRYAIIPLPPEASPPSTTSSTNNHPLPYITTVMSSYLTPSEWYEWITGFVAGYVAAVHGFWWFMVVVFAALFLRGLLKLAPNR